MTMMTMTMKIIKIIIEVIMIIITTMTTMMMIMITTMTITIMTMIMMVDMIMTNLIIRGMIEEDLLHLVEEVTEIKALRDVEIRGEVQTNPLITEEIHLPKILAEVHIPVTGEMISMNQNIREMIVEDLLHQDGDHLETRTLQEAKTPQGIKDIQDVAIHHEVAHQEAILPEETTMEEALKKGIRFMAISIVPEEVHLQADHRIHPLAEVHLTETLHLREAVPPEEIMIIEAHRKAIHSMETSTLPGGEVIAAHMEVHPLDQDVVVSAVETVTVTEIREGTRVETEIMDVVEIINKQSIQKLAA